MVPTASSVTGDEPEMAANMAQDRMVATARPPGSHWVRTRMTSISRSAIEPRVITLPAAMNMGIASRTSLLRLPHMSSTR